MSARRPTRRHLGLIAGLAATAFLLTACSSGSDDAASGPSATTSAEAKAVDGGDLTFAIGNDPISINPAGIGSGNDTLYVTRQLVDSLTWQDPKDGSLKPWLATKWEANADSTQFTFTLRDDVTYSDGTPFDADSVKKNFDDAVAAGAKSQAAPSFIGYVGTTVVDPTTVTVAFTTPNAAFPQATSTVALGFLADSTLAIPFDDRASGKGVVGTGPFTLDHYTKDTETVLKARPDYAWGPAGRENTGKAHIDSVTFQVIPEAGVRTGALSSGQVDVIGGVQPTDIETLKSSGFDLVSRANPGISFGLTFNEGGAVGADPAVREAIALTVNPTEVRDTALNDGFAVAEGPLASTTPGVADLSKEIVTDPKKAATILEKDGWAKGADGIYAKDGKPLAPVLAWITNFSPNQTSVELIQQELKANGIDAQLWSGAVPDFLAKLKDGSFDLVWGNLSRADGDVLRTQYSTASTNYYRLNDPDLEALLQKQLTVSDPTARNAVLADAQERLLSQHHVIPVHELTTFLGLDSTVHGVELGADSRLDQLTQTWIGS